MSELLELAERCEQAMEVEQCDLLYAAYRIVGPESHDWRWDHFLGLLNAKAYLDAAMMLVPEGWERFDVDATAPELGIDWTLHGRKREAKGTAATTALALCAAALRARTSMEGQPHEQ